MGIKLNKDPLAVLQNNYASKFVNVYIVYDFDACAKILLRNFAIKNCLFGATRIVKNSDNKNVYSGYVIAFDGKGEWSFDNDTTRNVLMFGLDNSSSSYADNLKNKF